MDPLEAQRLRVTATATVELLERGIIVQRYREDAQFCVSTIAENNNAIDELCQLHGPCALLVACPCGMRSNPPLMNVDHLRDQRERKNIRALAVVVDSQELFMAAKLYFVYHPQAFDTQVFQDERDALCWLRSKIE